MALLGLACTAAEKKTADSGPVANPPGGGEGATPAAVNAEAMRLVGNLPGSYGSFAFWGNLAVVTHAETWEASSPDDGFFVLDVSDPTQPTELSRFRCAGSYRDISVWKDLVFLSQNETTAGDGCDAAATGTLDPEAFAGIRVISIADPKNPLPVAAVPTGIEGPSDQSVGGSHTHTPVPDLDHRDASGQPSPRILVYSADGYDPGTEPHGTIVEVPLRDPSAAQVVGTIDNGTQVQCHDITVFIPRDLLVCGAHDAGVILFDISDPVHPVRLSHFDNPVVENHHSTAFSNDGTTLVLDDEVYTERCAGGTDQPSGALWFYDISNPGAPEERGFFQLPRPTPEHFCYAHESNVVPMPGPRDIVVTGWFGGGVNLVDFTDAGHPREIASWVSSELDGEHSFAYAGYWYNGHVYAANTAQQGEYEPVTHRGFDVFAVDHPALRKAIRLPHMNAQTQEPLPSL